MAGSGNRWHHRTVHLTFTPEVAGFILGTEIGCMAGCLFMFLRSLRLWDQD